MSDTSAPEATTLLSSDNPHSVRVLAFGYINLNVVDGSAFFMAGLSNMLARRVGVNVDLLAANRIHTDSVLNEIHETGRVTLIDPFTTPNLFDASRWTTDHTLTRREAADAIAFLDRSDPYDAIFVRDMEVVRYILEKYPQLSPRLIAYVTGVSFTDQELSDELRSALSVAVANDTRFCIQTTAMHETLCKQLPSFESATVHVLGPFVPDTEGDFESQFNFNSTPSRLVYAGKFFPNWIPDRIVAGFNYARLTNETLSLSVAGNAFRPDDSNANFVNEVKYLLQNSASVRWLGALNRTEVRSLVMESDVGVSWRSNSMDTSTEFSTKVLEYGALGRPSILNSSLVNRAVLGADYPLYVNDMSEYVNLLRNLPHLADEVAEAASRCWNAAQASSYSNVSENLLTFFGLSPRLVTDNAIIVDDRDEDFASITVSQREHVATSAMARAGKIVITTSSVPAVESRALPTVGSLLLDLQFQRELHNLKVEGRTVAAERATNRVLSASQNDTHQLLELRKTTASAEAEISALKRDSEQAITDLAIANERLEALRSSKLGRVQTWWWRKRGSRT